MTAREVGEPVAGRPGEAGGRDRCADEHPAAFLAPGAIPGVEDGGSRSQTPLDRLRRLCLSLPGTIEQEAWGAPTFRVPERRGRLFAMYASAGNHHGAGRSAVWCNAPVGVQEALVRSAPERFFVPPYVGVKGWIGIDLEEIDEDELAQLLLQSYCMVAPKRLQQLVDELTGTRSPRDRVI